MNTFLIIISNFFLSSKILFYIYPFINFFYKYTGKHDLLEKIIETHNNFLLNNFKNVKNVLILLPHCLQNNNCKYRITGSNITNCKQCGACEIGELLELASLESISLFVATGGTIARKIIKDNKPDFIIAVACENDIISGIKDVKKLPVALILNSRPNGPCFNTHVDIASLKKIINKVI